MQKACSRVLVGKAILGLITLRVHVGLATYSGLSALYIFPNLRFMSISCCVVFMFATCLLDVIKVAC